VRVGDLQERLAALYRLEHGLAVEDFLVTDAATAGALTPEGARGHLDERLLVRHDGDEVSLALYLDDALLERLRERNPLAELDDEGLADFWTAVEGISHFNYVVHNASARREVTLLELELQAEVDKFVSTMLLAREQGRRAVASRLHHLLFEGMSLDSELGDEERETLRAALVEIGLDPGKGLLRQGRAAQAGVDPGLAGLGVVTDLAHDFVAPPRKGRCELIRLQA